MPRKNRLLQKKKKRRTKKHDRMQRCPEEDSGEGKKYLRTNTQWKKVVNERGICDSR